MASTKIGFGLDSPLTSWGYLASKNLELKIAREESDRIRAEESADADRRTALAIRANQGVQQEVANLSEGMSDIAGEISSLTGSIQSSAISVIRTIEENAQTLASTIYVSSKALAERFDYGIGLLVDEMRDSKTVQLNIAAELAAIHETLRTPLRTQVNEFVQKGHLMLSRGLHDKALEAFEKALELDDTDITAQYQCGRIRLYGIVDDSPRLLDVDRAVAHLTDARRFAKAELRQSPSMRDYYLEICFTLGVAHVVRGRNLGTHEATEHFDDDLPLAAKLFGEISEADPAFAEALFQEAKCSLWLGNQKKVDELLDKLAFRFPPYIQKITRDLDLKSCAAKLDSRMQAYKEAWNQKFQVEVIDKVYRLLDEIEVFLLDTETIYAWEQITDFFKESWKKSEVLSDAKSELTKEWQRLILAPCEKYIGQTWQECERTGLEQLNESCKVIFGQEERFTESLESYLKEMLSGGLVVDSICQQVAKKYDYPSGTVVRWVLLAANQGNPESQCRVGSWLRSVLWYRQEELNHSTYWFKKSADQGWPEGIRNLASSISAGWGITKDTEFALKLYLKAGNAGSAKAYQSAAECYHEGEGTAVDFGKTVECLKKAVELGDPKYTYDFMLDLARLYETGGPNLAQDLELAREWTRKANEEKLKRTHE